VARRHHAVVRALCETAWTLGGQADMEVQGLLPGSQLRPDLRMVFHGDYLLSDVQVNHPLAPSYVSRVAGGKPMTVARASAGTKRSKYERMRRHVGATFIPFIADSYGGLSEDSFLLVERMADAAQLHMAMWQREQIVRHVLSNVAVAIQRENAATVLAGHAAIDFSRRGPEESDKWHEGATDEDDEDEDEDEAEEEIEDEDEEGEVQAHAENGDIDEKEEEKWDEEQYTM
jgi:hypothetical protein